MRKRAHSRATSAALQAEGWYFRLDHLDFSVPKLLDLEEVATGKKHLDDEPLDTAT